MANRKRLCDALFTAEGILCETPGMTAEAGAEIAGDLRVGSVVSLEGPLGAGKTQLIKGLARALGCTEAVSSPSFAIVHEYLGSGSPVYHFDFYRMESSEELITAGYDDCLADGITLIEWGDKFPEMLPAGAWRLQIEILSDGTRRIRGGKA